MELIGKNNEYDLEDYAPGDEITVLKMYDGVYTSGHFCTVWDLASSLLDTIKENPQGIRIEVTRIYPGTKEVDGFDIPARRRVMSRELTIRDVRHLCQMIAA